jgi:F0F1-type ATP synthase membrane subunit b/b'
MESQEREKIIEGIRERDHLITKLKRWNLNQERKRAVSQLNRVVRALALILEGKRLSAKLDISTEMANAVS